MNDVPEWKIPKWPFLAANFVLIAIAGAVIYKAAHPVSGTLIFTAIGCTVLGALLGCLPFILDYRATGKLIEVHAVGEVSEKIQDLKRVAAQVSTATDQWARVQEITQGSAEKTVAAAQEIAGRMEAEVQEFNDFQSKMNDAEKGALRLEAEKLRRAEKDWLQVIIRILDNIFVLHLNAVRSGHPELATHLGQFQNACQAAARRVGLTPFVPAADEPFDAERHRLENDGAAPAGAVVDQAIAPGFTYQGRPLRAALVRLRQTDVPASVSENPETEQLPLPAE